MERKKQKTLLVILMIVTILATDFFVLSSGIKTYASQLNGETNNPNIEFSTYFKEGENRVDSIEKSIKAEDVRLYAEIKVKKEVWILYFVLLSIFIITFVLTFILVIKHVELIK